MNFAYQLDKSTDLVCDSYNPLQTLTEIADEKNHGKGENICSNDYF